MADRGEESVKPDGHFGRDGRAARPGGMLVCLAVLAAVAAPGAAAQPGSELPQWVLDLAHAKRHNKPNFERLPDYACALTVERFDKAPQSSAFRPMDVLRLEVAVVEGKELYAREGRGFENSEPAAFISSGSFGTGTFSTIARNLFVSDGARTTGHSRETDAGRPLLRFDYEISQMYHPFRLSSGGVAAEVGECGSFWVDAATWDLVEIEDRAVDIPPELRMTDVVTKIRYGKVRIGASEVILPETAETVIANLDGRQTKNVTRFSGCRQYGSESKITFDTEVVPGGPPAPGPRKK
jgi:hypothetical protein